MKNRTPSALTMLLALLIVFASCSKDESEPEPETEALKRAQMGNDGWGTGGSVTGAPKVRAMEIIAEKKVDLILLDIMLPVIDGFEVCQRVRENPRWNKIKIILLTALGSDANVEKGLALGADAYITKPFSNIEIVDKVKELLEE